MMIREFLKKYRIRYLMIGIVYFIIIEIAVIIFGLAVSSLLLIPYQYLIPLAAIPLFFVRIPNLKRLAHRIETQYQGLRNLLVIAYDLETGNFEKEGYSQELIDKSIARTEEAINLVKPRVTVHHKRAVTIGAACSIAIFLLTVIFFPGRLLYNLKPALNISVYPMGGTFTKDSTVVFNIRTSGNLLPDRGTFVFMGLEKRSLDVKLVGGCGSVSLPITEKGHISFSALRNRTPHYSIIVRKKTTIDSIITRVEFPPYTKLHDLRTRERSITAVEGAVVTIKPYISPLQDAEYFVGDKRVRGPRFDISGDLTVKIKSNDGVEDSVYITCLKDLAPSVVIFQPGQDIDLPKSMVVDLMIRITDDFRVVKASLRYRIKDESFSITFPDFRPSYDETIYYDWDLSRIKLSPGDTLEYAVSASDDIQKSSSRSYKIIFPSMSQIYDEITSGQEYLKNQIANLSESTDEKVSEVEEIKESFLRKRKLDWSEINELKKISTENQQLKEMIKDWQNQWQELSDRLAKAKVVEPEVISKIEEISKLISEIVPEQFESAIERLEKMIDQNPEQFEKQLDQILQNQELLKESLDRTIELLKRFQKEEYLRRLKELAEELKEKEDEVKSRIEDKEMGALNLSKKIEDGIGELKTKVHNSPEEIDINDRLEKIEGVVDSLQIETLAGRQTGEIEEQDWERAQVTAGLLSENLEQIRKDLKAMYQETIAKRRKEIKKRIERRIEQLVKISKDQETVLSGHGDPHSYEQIIKTNVEAISESIISDRQVSLHIPASAALLLARALNDIDEVLRFYSTGLGREAQRSAINGMSNINRTVNILFSALEDMNASGSPSGLDAFQQQLNSMAQQQISISQALSKLLPIPASGMSADLQQKIRQLAEKQKALRKAVEKHAGASELARNTAEEMKDIEEALFHYRIDRKLIDRQNQLITRLLDADRSIRKDKLEERRISEGGQDIARRSPETLILERPDLLREMIMKELRRPYPEEYQRYIRLYYQILLGERQDDEVQNP